MERRTDPLTEESWAWFDRNKRKHLSPAEAEKSYYAGEFAAMLERAREDIASLTKQRTEANNQWRLDYNELAEERDALSEQLGEVRGMCEREAERFPRVMGDFAREIIKVLDAPRISSVRSSDES